MSPVVPKVDIEKCKLGECHTIFWDKECTHQDIHIKIWAKLLKKPLKNGFTAALPFQMADTCTYVKDNILKNVMFIHRTKCICCLWLKNHFDGVLCFCDKLKPFSSLRKREPVGYHICYFYFF